MGNLKSRTLLFVVIIAAVIVAGLFFENMVFKKNDQKVDAFLVEKMPSPEVVDFLNVYCEADTAKADPNVVQYFQYRTAQQDCKLNIGLAIAELYSAQTDDDAKTEVMKYTGTCFETAKNNLPIMTQASLVGPYQTYLVDCINAFEK